MGRRTGRWLIAKISTALITSVSFAFSAAVFAQEPQLPQAKSPIVSQPPITTQAPLAPVQAVPTAGATTAALPTAPPLAVVSVDGVELSGAMEVVGGKASIGANGSITAGEHTANVTLPGRGQIRLCATTRLGLSADTSIAAALGPNEAPGLMMALDRGAMETSFTTGTNSDVILTPDFRITISGPGKSSVQVRLGDKGDTCVDNHGPNAPYVLVSGVFEGGVYRVQDGQRVLFEHGSLHEVVDSEKESCGCPEEPVPAVTAHPLANPFPAAQSAGLAPLKAAPPSEEKPGVESAQATATLHYNGDDPRMPDASVTAAAPEAPAAKPAKKEDAPKGFFGRIGHFFRNLFGG